MKHYDPKDIPTPQLHEILLGTIAPRPIAWASTIDGEGNVNLAPFSFFNVFGSNPPILVFSPSRRVRDNTTKHTIDNLHATMECVVNIGNFALAQQMVLTSTEYGAGVNEFTKAGLTMEPSVLVKAPRIGEAPAQYECKVRDIISMGEHGGAGSLVICEVIYVHVSEEIYGEDGKIDPHKMDAIGRMGGIWYSRAAEGLFQIPTPGHKLNVGFDALPEHIRHSRYLTGSELAQLARIEVLPSQEEVDMVTNSTGMKDIFSLYHNDKDMIRSKIHNLAKELIHEGKIEEAWRVLLSWAE